MEAPKFDSEVKSRLAEISPSDSHSSSNEKTYEEKTYEEKQRDLETEWREAWSRVKYVG